MTCRLVIAVMGDYLGKDLRPDTESSFEKHLSSCPDCPALLNTYGKTVRVAQSVRYDDISCARLSRIRGLLHDRIREVSTYH